MGHEATLEAIRRSSVCLPKDRKYEALAEMNKLYRAKLEMERRGSKYRDKDSSIKSAEQVV